MSRSAVDSVAGGGGAVVSGMNSGSEGGGSMMGGRGWAIRGSYVDGFEDCGAEGLNASSGPSGKRETDGFGAGFATGFPFFAWVLRGIKVVGVTVMEASSVSSTGFTSTTSFAEFPFVVGFDRLGGGSIENNPPFPSPSGLNLFLIGSLSCDREGFGRSTMICFLDGFGGRVAWCGLGTGGV